MTTYDFWKLVGVTVYSSLVFLTVIWAAVGLSYWRQSKTRKWLWMTISLSAFAVLFAGLSIVAAEPAWLERTTMQVINRLFGLVAVSTGSWFTWLYLRAEWRRTNKAKSD